jgi:hypothetical protein
VVRHIANHGDPDSDVVHIGGALLVRRTVLRLCLTSDPLAGVAQEPYVLVGDDEFTLHEAEALLGALTQLVEQGQQSFAPKEPQSAFPVLDP